MKFAWRPQSTCLKIVSVCTVTILCGCQTWSPSNWGVPAGSRVPPPPTGSYQHQGAYYSNPATGTASGAAVSSFQSTTPNFPSTQSAASTNSTTSSSNGMVVQASGVNAINSSPNGSPYATAFSNSPATQTDGGATSLGFQGSRTQVSTADYTDNGSGMAQVVSADALQAPPDQGLQNQNVDYSAGAGTNGSTGELQWK